MKMDNSNKILWMEGCTLKDQEEIQQLLREDDDEEEVVDPLFDELYVEDDSYPLPDDK